MSELLRREGFWYSTGEPYLPMPIVSGIQWAGKEEFLDSLEIVEAEAEKTTFRGFSTCRVCHKPNGSREYTYGGWKWPAGYSHYVRDHNVRPSLAFHEFIIGRQL